MRLIAILGAVALLAVAGCASDPRTAWAQQSNAYASLVETANQLREPCFLAGPDSPGCVLKDPVWDKVKIARDTADGYLKAADRELAACEAANDDLPLADEVGLACADGAFRRYLRQAVAALAALAAHIGAPPPTQ